MSKLNNDKRLISVDSASSKIDTVQSNRGIAQSNKGIMLPNTNRAQFSTDAMQPNMNTAQYSVNTTQSSMSIAQSDVDIAQSDVDTAQSDMGTVQSDIDRAQLVSGLVTSVHKTGFAVHIDNEICDCKSGSVLKGSSLQGASTHFCIINNSYKNLSRPVVGDIVYLQKIQDKLLIIDIKERKNVISRFDYYKDREQIFASNVDTVFIITSANKEFSLARVNRFMRLVSGRGARIVVVLTKVDECDKSDLYIEKLKHEFPSCDQIYINATLARDCERLLDYIKEGGTALLLGSSGVGKSTIINSLCSMNLRTSTVQGEKHGNRGKHTTSARNLYFTKCGRKIIDCPGIRIVGVHGEFEKEISRGERIRRR